jgi:hypothetical protein
MGREPGWQAYVVTGGVALGFLVMALLMWRRSRLLGLAALTALLLVMFWDAERPLNALVGAIFAVLSAVMVFK